MKKRKEKKSHSVQSSLCQWAEKWMDKNIFSLIIHHLKRGHSVAAGRILPSFLPSFKHWKWVQFEEHLLCGISESAGSNNGPLEQGPFLLLIAATCVVGKSPLPAPLALEHVQNRPHSHWVSTASSKHTLIAKSGAPGWRAGGCARTLCSRWRTASAFTFQDWLKVVTGHAKMAKWGHSVLRM